jgi:hypothetical protein
MRTSAPIRGVPADAAALNAEAMKPVVPGSVPPSVPSGTVVPSVPSGGTGSGYP